jgi:hypothetical protein
LRGSSRGRTVRTMTSSLPRLLTATGLALALLAPSVAQAQTLPVGEAHGVRLVEDHGVLVLIFSHRSAKLRERINSRYAWMDCTELGDVFSNGFGGNLDVPPHGRRVSTGFDSSNADFCRFFLRSHTVKRHGSRHHVSRRVLFSIPLTQAGAVYLDEESKVGDMFTVGLLAELIQDDQKLAGAPTYAQLLQEYPKLARVAVELAAPGDSPPPRRVGYFSDGHEHTALAVLSTLGRRLFIEQSAGEVLNTNVAKYLFADPL